jgi:23S rRNA pseudouridine1911/1915/1917 synthase
MVPSLKIENHDKGERLDAILARTYPQYSRAFFQKFMKKGGVTLSGNVREPSYRVRVGEIFQVANFEAFALEPAPRPGPGASSDVEPQIIFEDKALLIIDKPAGLVVHPAPGHRVGTLTDWLKRHLGPSVSKVFTDPERLGLVHRLDKDTSGVLVIAKSVLSQTAISRQFQDRTVQKTYTAFVEGVPSAKEGVINAPIGRSRKVATRMSVSTLGKDSETRFQVIESLKEVSQVSVQPKTGRTHQIRVHMAAIGHPIVGDRTYGAKSVWTQTHHIGRPLLHAERLELNHPTTGKRVEFTAPWPADFYQAQRLFRQIFKSVLVIAGAGLMWVVPVRAQDSPVPAKKPGPLATDVKKLKRDAAAMQESIANLSEALDKLDADGRLRDIERAVSDLNSKAVASGAGAEETKTQLMEINRKLKSQEDVLNQLRDQIDRLNRQVIRQQSSGGSGSAGAGGPP